MGYTFSKEIPGTLEEAVPRVSEALAARGFGVLTSIDVAATLKAKLDVSFRPYVILGACNPQLAHRALTEEPNIGVMLPCNVVVQQMGSDRVHVSAVDPVASMQAVDNPALVEIAGDVQQRLREVIEGL